MDRPVKERLIGACVLVVLVVAVVPELLSGPKPAAPAADASAAGALRLPAGAPDPMRNVTVDLTTSQPTAPADAAWAPAGTPPPTHAGGAGSTAAGDAPGAAASSVTAPIAAAPVVSPNGAAAPGAAATAPAVENAPAPPTSRQGFAVQLGSFANRSNAENLVHQLKARGFSIYMDAEGSGAGTRYRVRVGPLADRDAAARTVDNLKRLGHVATIVSPRQG